jgi:radical SAM protein with 4Fe4S-binding SPASM domain
MSRMLPQNEFIVLAPHCSLKRLEEPYLYDRDNDELYELSQDAFDFLVKCSLGERPPVKKEDEEFIQYCLSENLIVLSRKPNLKRKAPQPSPIPSLRYLELQVTDRCNLRCRHCYLGNGANQDLTFDRIQKVLVEFEAMQGLRLLLSGGEPLLHAAFWRMNENLRDYDFRSVMLSNGVLITREVAKRLRVHEVQISLDGIKAGHELIRGEGTFEKVLQAIDHLQESHIRVSIATMIHRGNVKEFEAMDTLIRSRNIEEWNIDQPCLEGRLKENQHLFVPPSEAGRLLRYGFGGGLHHSGKDTTCGAYLCAILPNGGVAKCGLFSREPVGSMDQGLRTCWERIPRISLTELECQCKLLEECRGGCRYRARNDAGILSPDLFQCYAREVLKGGD